jgi:hypothetical protein
LDQVAIVAVMTLDTAAGTWNQREDVEERVREPKLTRLALNGLKFTGTRSRGRWVCYLWRGTDQLTAYPKQRWC